MYGINEIKKINSQKQADHDNSRAGTYCVLRNGGILIRSGVFTKTLDDKEDVQSFVEKVKGKSSGIVRNVVQSYFTKDQVPA
jgi:hypothetical protein